MKKNYILLTFLAFICTIILLNSLLPTHTFKTQKEQYEYLLNAKDYIGAEEVALNMIKKDSCNIENYVHYVKSYFESDTREEKSLQNEDDRYVDIIEFLSDKTKSKNPIVADCGYYGLGLYYSMNDNHDMALERFNLVKNKNIPFLNNSKGYVFIKKNLSDSAEHFFKKEILNKGNLEGAYSNLADLYLKNKRFESLNKLLIDKAANENISLQVKRASYFNNNQFVSYIGSIIIEPIENAKNYFGFISALLILLTWLIYLRKIDIFEPVKWSDMAIMFFMGAVFSFGVYPISDIITYHLNFDLNDNLLNDFFYCFLGIGLVEESMKIIPFLILLKYTNKIKEPVDYIIYASTSALGFAFVENIKYFDYYGLDIIHGRALVAVIIHMACSSIIAYGLIYNKFVSKRNFIFKLLQFLLIAALVHGLFDFWLINPTAKNLAIISILMTISLISLFNSFINNTLNQSEFYSEEKTLNKGKMERFVFISLASIFILEYIVVGIQYSSKTANTTLITSMGSGSYLLAFLSSSLSRFKLRKGKWDKLHFFGVKEGVDYSEGIVNKQIKMVAITINEMTESYLPNEMEITANVIVGRYPNFYLCKVKHPAMKENFLDDTILLRAKNTIDKIKINSRAVNGVYLIKKSDDIDFEQLKPSQLLFIGYAAVENTI